MSETILESPAELEPNLSPTQALRENLETAVHLIEEELGLIDRQSRQASVRIENWREKRDQAETIRRLVLRNPSSYSPSEVEEAIQTYATAVTELGLAELRYDHLTERQGQAREHLKQLRDALQLALDAARDADMHPPDEEAATFRNASRQVFQIIEEERMRIARDMHDGPAQSMSNLVLQAEILERLVARSPDKVVAELVEFKSSVRSALEETRRLIFDLRPMTLDDLGLIPTLRRYVKEFGEKHGVSTRFNLVGEEGRLSGNMEGTLFRLIQEALTNVHKHARAHTAEVTLALARDRVTATVRDDGVGFDTAAVEAGLARNRSLGLISMRERAELERGSLAIKSQPGEGTEVRVEFHLT